MIYTENESGQAFSGVLRFLVFDFCTNAKWFYLKIRKLFSRIHFETLKMMVFQSSAFCLIKMHHH